MGPCQSLEGQLLAVFPNGHLPKWLAVYTEETSLSRSADSLGFVLGEGEDDDDPLLTPHERLEDFRKRIRKRTRRRLSRRRSSSSSYVGGSSSDMDDILEDPEGGPAHYPLRPASSEPSLRLATPTCPPPKSPLSADAETVLVSMSGRRLMVTSSNGHLKAYSYDGVSPNLPVPFRARFRQRRAPSSFEEDPQPERPRAAVEADPEGGGDLQLRVSVLWLAASMANLHSLLLYTLNHEQLNEVCKVYGVVVQREWTVGDLSCEVLRFCRNRQRWAATRLFGQILGRRPPRTP
ncbi:poly(ADP-ribose) glycohydrolase [Caerostris extrusa]|uniref:Poly(ADP-ribose) glycohydrolase n=1 Tax=Caerostris extrusa TaxID=172846 RepID=A0AAV4SJ31_CAEEX|nr:poly(ADP-ribose) glycohydrolase [Caerostris extrusa]